MAIFAKMVYLVKMAEKVIKCQNRHTLNKYSNEMAKGPLESGNFGKIGKFGENGGNGE